MQLIGLPFLNFMAQDPAFLFYPGDYLRDTQCLSEKSQVAYDRIMCEHMRNICEDMTNITVSQESVNFFTKRLNDDEKFELFSVIRKVGNAFQISWVAESISKRRAYSDSRRKNKMGKPKHISSTYDAHMENAIEIVNEDESKKYKIEDCLNISMADSRYVKANNTNREELQKFNDYLEKQGVYEINPLDYKRYFAKLKGKYPDLIKAKLTADDYRRLIEEKEKQRA